MATYDLRARKRLSDRLRELREQTGSTGVQFAQRLGWGQPKVSKIETGRQLPSEADVTAWARATDADARELLALLEQARAEYATFRDLYAATGGADRLQDAIAVQEATAMRLVMYQPVLVLGILQTADYAYEMLHLPSGPGGVSGATEDEISRMIAARVRRQAILYEPGRDITLIMGEGALRTRLASPATMVNQMEHIARLAGSLTTTTIAIVPFSAPAPIASLSGYSIRDDMVTIETFGGNLEIADPVEVARYEHYTRLLRDAALTGPDAVALIQRVAAELRG